MKLLTLLLLMTPLSSKASSVFFADFCSKEEIKISTPNGTVLALRLQELDPNLDLQLKIIFRPSGVIEDLKPYQQMKLNYRISARKISRSGELSLNINAPSIKWMASVERSFQKFKVWDAEVIWIQNNKAQSVVTSYYRAPKKKDYYEIKSKELCTWEGKAEVDSTLYENRDDEMMNVVRDSRIPLNEDKEKGISFGYTQNALEQVPVGSLGAGNFGWIFDEWREQFEDHKSISIKRVYTLSRNEAGIFLKRPSYARHKAIKYSWDSRHNGCGAYVPVSHGHIDISKSSEDFMVIPANYYGREQISEFIEMVRPAINTCKSFPMRNAIDASDIISSGLNGSNYFYELGSL